MTLAEFAQSLARNYCARVNGCCEAYVGEFDQPACVSMEAAETMEQLEALSALPGLRFDGRAASKCLKHSQIDPLCDLDATLRGCDDAFVGQLAPGAECERTRQCTREPNETVTCDRKCVITRRMVGSGDACDETCGVDCSNESNAETDGKPVRACPAEQGLQCGPEGRCESLRPNGDACTVWVQCASSYCSNDGGCEDAPDRDALEGDACSSTVRCAEDLTCEDGVCFYAIEDTCKSLDDRLP